MKQTPNFSKAEEAMQPGVITADGFLGNDTRHLSDIISHDEEAFASLGLDFDALADLLQELLEKGQAGLGEPITVDGKWLVHTDDARGYLPTPFGGKVFHKINVRVQKSSGGPKLVYSELNIHMIRNQHFLEGRGSAFRMEPADIKEVLYS